MIEFIVGWKIDEDTYAGAPFLVLAPSLDVAQAVVATMRQLPTGRRAQIIGTMASEPHSLNLAAGNAIAAEVAKFFVEGR